SFLVAATNALVFEWLYQARWFRRLFSFSQEPYFQPRRSLWAQTAGVALLLATSLTYGLFRLNQNSFESGLRLALIQGNLSQEIRNDATSSVRMVGVTLEHFCRLCDRAAVQTPAPQLIVWSENSCPRDWTENPPGQPT